MWWKYVICDAALAILILILFRCVFLLAWVKGASMRDTLSDRDILLARRYGRRRDVRRFDVVLCRYPNRKETFVKRVIALPNEMISIQKGVTYINGVPLPEDFPHRSCARSYLPGVLGADEYFVMGDNRPSSSDSRNVRVGAIFRSMIRARVSDVLLPRRRKIQYEGEIRVNKRKIVAFGDSNTWGWDPSNRTGICNRWPDDVRWTGVLQRELGDAFEVINEGLNGRTTVWDDPIEEYRCGKDQLPVAMDVDAPFELLIIMLGTNDCKTRYRASASVIAKGLDQVIRKARQNASRHFDLLVISPIHLGVSVGDADFDPEFDAASVAVSRNLANEYRKIALQNHAAFLNASDFAAPSVTDREHMDEKGHAALADAIYNKILALQKGLSHVI